VQEAEHEISSYAAAVARLEGEEARALPAEAFAAEVALLRAAQEEQRWVRGLLCRSIGLCFQRVRALFAAEVALLLRAAQEGQRWVRRGCKQGPVVPGLWAVLKACEGVVCGRGGAAAGGKAVGAQR